MTPLRFTHDQVAHDSGYVQETLETVAHRLESDESDAADAGISRA